MFASQFITHMHPTSTELSCKPHFGWFLGGEGGKKLVGWPVICRSLAYCLIDLSLCSFSSTKFLTSSISFVDPTWNLHLVVTVQQMKYFYLFIAFALHLTLSVILPMPIITMHAFNAAPSSARSVYVASTNYIRLSKCVPWLTTYPLSYSQPVARRTCTSVDNASSMCHERPSRRNCRNLEPSQWHAYSVRIDGLAYSTTLLCILLTCSFLFQSFRIKPFSASIIFYLCYHCLPCTHDIVDHYCDLYT